MIIHCLSCGKSTSTNLHRCPYCCSEISETTLELNGVQCKEKNKSRVAGFVFGYAKS